MVTPCEHSLNMRRFSLPMNGNIRKGSSSCRHAPTSVRLTNRFRWVTGTRHTKTVTGG